MKPSDMHEGHAHTHGVGCGHPTVEHEGHTDYLHEGHLHHVNGAQVDEHAFAVGDANPDRCTPGHACGIHEASHVHGPTCGHPGVPHGDHTDYMVGSHLHHPHGEHCDDHGVVRAA
jgi:hypothetical protein